MAAGTSGTCLPFVAGGADIFLHASLAAVTTRLAARAAVLPSSPLASPATRCRSVRNTARFTYHFLVKHLRVDGHIARGYENMRFAATTRTVAGGRLRTGLAGCSTGGPALHVAALPPVLCFARALATHRRSRCTHPRDMHLAFVAHTLPSQHTAHTAHALFTAALHLPATAATARGARYTTYRALVGVRRDGTA